MAIQAQQLCTNNNLGFPLCGSSQDLMTENGLLAQSCFNNPQQKQDLHQLFNQRQWNQDVFDDTNLLFSGNNNARAANNNHPSSSPSVSQSLNLQFHKQSQDIDRYIRLQNEKLIMMLQEQRKLQVASLLKKVESDAIYMLQQKDQEIVQATKKTMELEQFVRRLEEENQAWRREAQKKEAMVLSLHKTLEQVKERASYGFNNGVEAEDAGSCCNEEVQNGGGIIVEEDEQVEEIGKKKMMNCKNCKYGKACILFLPCRHLCSCRECEALLQACPVCSTPKKARIEILIF